MSNKRRSILIVLSLVLGLSFISGCGFLENAISELKGSLIGNEYIVSTYDNYGEKNLVITGDKISISGNPIRETGYTSGGSVVTNYSLSSVITITIDGHEIESCGDTMIFAGKGLEPIVDFSIENIESSSNGVSGLTSINRVLNEYENLFGKSRVVVIKSQLGVPICVFEGDNVYWEIPEDLPKMTKLMIDEKPLYIHRANYQIIDTALIR